MENKKAPSAVQEKVVQLAAGMVDVFMPCDGGGMILGYAAILVLEKGIREELPPGAAALAREIAGSIKAEMEDR